MKKTALCILVVFLQSTAFGAEVPERKVQYRGVGNVTAAVALAQDFFVVACAEDNILRIYKMASPYAPVASFDLSGHLDIDPAIPTTLAGAAKVRNRIYWITSHSRDENGRERAVRDRIYWMTSHSRDENGRERPERYRFFATTVTEKEGRITIEPVGKTCKTLFHKLVDLRTVRTLRLNKATRFGESIGEKERRKLIPLDEGLNVGALCASHNSNMIYIALRNPRPIRVITGTPHALVVPLDNAAEVIEKGENPIFGEGMLWYLQGRGIVGFEYSPSHKDYFVVAAPHDVRNSFALYRWSGMKALPPKLMTLPDGPGGLFASTIVPFENQSRILLLGEEIENAIVPEPLDGASRTKSFLAFWYQP
jgi:hypothetical protein